MGALIGSPLPDPPTSRPRVAALGGVVGAAEDGAFRRRRRRAPGIDTSVVAPRRLVPLGLAGKPPAAPRAVVAGPEPRHLHHGVMLEPGVRDPPTVSPMYARVLVVLVESPVAVGRTRT